MEKVYSLAPQQVHDAIQNAIRVFNEYRMDKKRNGNKFFILTPSALFYQYELLVVPDGTLLRIEAGGRYGKISNEEASQSVSQFITRLDQIINGHILLTADVVNRDVYKSGQGVIGAIWLIRLIIAIVAIIMGIMVLSKL